MCMCASVRKQLKKGTCGCMHVCNSGSLRKENIECMYVSAGSPGRRILVSVCMCVVSREARK